MALIVWMFILANVFSLFVALVFLISFLENQDKLKSAKSPPKTLPGISMVIPAYNESTMIEECLQRVAELDYPHAKLEVIVVDDGSKDDTLGKARRKAKQLEGKTGIKFKVITQENKGKAAALNTGIKLAKYDYIATVDSDSFVEKQALQKMTGYFSDKEVGSVTASVKIESPHSTLQWLQYIEYLSMNYTRKVAAFLNGVHCTPGPLSIFTRKAIEKTGGFDEGNLAEDTEMALHLHKEGFRIENAFDAVVTSEAPYSFKGLLRQRVRWYQGVVDNAKKYSFIFFNKKFGNLGVFILPANFIAVLLAMFIFFKVIYEVGLKIAFLAWGSFNSVFFGYTMPAVPFELNPFYWLNVETVFVFFYALIVLIALYYTFKTSDERFSFARIPLYAAFLFLYSFIVTIFWITGLMKSLTGSKTRWH